MPRYQSLQFRRNLRGQWRWGMYPRVIMMGLSAGGIASLRLSGSLAYLLRLGAQARRPGRRPGIKWIERSDQPATLPGITAAALAGRRQGHHRHRWRVTIREGQ